MKPNVWYVVAKENKRKRFGYSQLTKKGEFYSRFNEADEDRIYFQPDYKEKLVVLERTCKVIE